MIIEIVQAFALIFIAEMGDKSQILAMTFASKYKLRNVIIGLFIGISFNHLLAILLGSNLDRIIPIDTLSIIAGVLFILFGIWTLQHEDEEVSTSQRFGPIVTVAIAFFLGELGDKTQLTAIALSSDALHPWLVLAGTISGMMFTSLIGIYVGIKLGSKIPEYTIKVVSSAVFLLFGFVKLYTMLDVQTISSIYMITVVLLITALYGYRLNRYTKSYQESGISLLKDTAAFLQETYTILETKIEEICLGENHCGTCGGTNCLIGTTKAVIKKAKRNKKVDYNYLQSPLVKYFDKKKVEEALLLVVDAIKDIWDDESSLVLHQVRKNLERIYFGFELTESTYAKYIASFNKSKNKNT